MSLSAFGWGSAALIVATFSSILLNSSIEITRRPLYRAAFFSTKIPEPVNQRKVALDRSAWEPTACNEDRRAIDSAPARRERKDDECLPSLRVAKKTNRVIASSPGGFCPGYQARERTG